MANNNSVATPRRWYQKPATWIKLCTVTTIIAIIIIGIVLRTQIWDVVIAFLKWMKSHLIIGSWAYFGIHVAWVTIALPATYLTIGAGFVYAHILPFWTGVFVSTLISLAGSCVGSIFAFLNGRYVFRRCVVSSFEDNNKWAVIEHLAQAHGIKLSLLLRFTFVPSSMVNYGTSVTKLLFFHFLIGLFALIPDIFVHSLVGAEFDQFKDMLSGHISKSEMPLFIAGMVVMVISVILVIFVVYYAKKQFDRMVAQQEAQDKREEELLLANANANGNSDNKTDNNNNNEGSGIGIITTRKTAREAENDREYGVPKKFRNENKFWRILGKFGFSRNEDGYAFEEEYQSLDKDEIRNNVAVIDIAAEKDPLLPQN